MEKGKRAPKVAAPEPMVSAAPLVINPFGPTKQRVVAKSKIVSSEFTLDDGTKLLVTPIVADVRRAIDQFNQEGDPLYFLTMGQTVKTVSPPSLRRKPPSKHAVKTAKKKKKK
jgi:hypothetical protein